MEPLPPPEQGIKRELPPELPPTSDTVPIKRQASESRGLQSVPAKFPWATCEDKDHPERMIIKERAVGFAEEHCMKIRAVLESAIGTAPFEKAMFRQWLKDHEELRRKRQSHEILVGVEGPTGAGKSSFLGAILFMHELFPSGQEGAATAVVGKASWNWDDTPGHEYRAKVTMRKKNDIETTILSLLKDLKRISILKTTGPRDDEDLEEREDEITNTENRINWELPKLKAVWGVKREELKKSAEACTTDKAYKNALQWVLSKNPQAYQFLQDGIVEFNASKMKKLTAQVKPFLDSSPAKHGTGRLFSVWPLIQEVHLYIKSPLLKTGMTVVDLPGCGDATASRSEVAKKFSHRLDVRLVVSPIARATDEQHGQVLMQSGFDEALMKIRGKYDGNGFGVVLSKTDEIDIDAYINGSDELQNDSETQMKLEEYKGFRNREKAGEKKIKGTKSKLEEVETRSAKADKAYMDARKGLAARGEEQTNARKEEIERLRKEAEVLTEACERGSKMLKEYQSKMEKLQQEIVDADDWFHEKASQTRNRNVSDRLQETHATRQAALNRTDKDNHPLPIFPVSTKAFWPLKRNKSPMQGYKTFQSTGIPDVQWWLLKATMSKREKHLDDMLGGYERLMSLMRFYSQEKGQDGNFTITRSTVENALAKTHRDFSMALGMQLSNAAAEIQQLDPLEDEKRICKTFCEDARSVVAKFPRKYPGNERSPDLMRANTYASILSRGGEHKVKSTGIAYDFNEDLAAPLLRTVAKGFDDLMNKKVAEVKAPIMNAFKKTWAEYVSALQRVVKENLPVLE
ncbi:GTPase SLIP-GC, partial [Fusarium austroafricanum]